MIMTGRLNWLKMPKMTLCRMRKTMDKQKLCEDDDTTIGVLGGHIRLKQPSHGFRTSLDSIMLAASVPSSATGRMLDMGCGVGGAGLPALWRCPGLSLTGIDNEQEFINLADGNALLNDMDDRE